MKSIRLYVLMVSIAALLAAAVLSIVAGAWSRQDLTAAAFFAGFGVLAEALQYQRSRGRSGISIVVFELVAVPAMPRRVDAARVGKFAWIRCARPGIARQVVGPDEAA